MGYLGSGATAPVTAISPVGAGRKAAARSAAKGIQSMSAASPRDCASPRYTAHATLSAVPLK